MIEAHTLDAWTRADAKHGPLFRDLTVLGGFAAPLFLWLAGLAVVLSATRAAERTGSQRSALEAIVRRGLQIFLLAFLFRLQGFIITPGGPPISLFRVDILNVMGPAVVGAAGVWACAKTTARRVAGFAAVAAAFALVTPIVRASPFVDTLPMWFQWYLRPSGEHTTFTLFPWAGFVFAGGAVGALLATTRDEESERRLQALLGAAGIAIVAFGFYTAGRPSIYRLSSFWTSSPTWFAIRVGVLMIAVAVIYVVGRGAVFARLGRHSLLIYWIHVELVYGYASWLWRGRLNLWGLVIAYAAFCLLMFRALVLRDHLVGLWRNRRIGPTPQTAHA
jgi:uncharacterized membrane protein